MQPADRPWWQQITALVSVSVGGAVTGFAFVPHAASDLRSPAGLPVRLLALERAAQPERPAPGDDATLRAAIVNVARYYLRMAERKTPAQMEAIIWQHTSLDGADHGPSCAAFASLTLELGAQAAGQRSWVTGGTSYPWPLPAWADVRVQQSATSPGIVSVQQDAQAHHRWYPEGSGYRPLPGDWVLFEGHVEVVTGYSHGVLHTVGGDSLPDFSVNAHEYADPLAGHGVLGFVNNGMLAVTERQPAPGGTARRAPGQQGAGEHGTAAIPGVAPAPAPPRQRQRQPDAATGHAPAPYRRHVPDLAAPAAGESASQQAFIREVAPGAMAAQRAYGIPASVTIAQAIDESGWGGSTLAARDHNLFGIKGTGPAGTASLPTQEYVNGRLVTRTAQFRVYHDAAESISDHGRLLATSGYYRQAMAHRHDPNAFAAALTGVYATDPGYGAKLIALMRRYNLYRYDTAALIPAQRGTLADATPPASAAQPAAATSPAVAGPRGFPPEAGRTPGASIPGPAIPGHSITGPGADLHGRPAAAGDADIPGTATGHATAGHSSAGQPGSQREPAVHSGAVIPGATGPGSTGEATTGHAAPVRHQSAAPGDAAIPGTTAVTGPPPAGWPQVAAPLQPASGGTAVHSGPAAAEGWPAVPGQPEGAPGPGTTNQPADPTWIAVPGQPADPSWIAAPSQPAHPTWAATPGQPADPTWAAVPGQPADPTWVVQQQPVHQSVPAPAQPAPGARPATGTARSARTRAAAVRRYQLQIPPSVRTSFAALAKVPLLREEPLYRDIAGDTGIRWQLLAACDWMQCRAQPRYSPVHGEKLGTPNPDGTVYRTRSEALAQCADDLVQLSHAVYGIDVTAPDHLSVQELASVFAAFRWGRLLKLHRTSAMEFPYSVAGLTADHLSMRWPNIDEPQAPDKPGSRFRMPFGAVPIVLCLNYHATVR